MGVAAFYVLLAADFVAMVQVLVYVGGILVLTMFAVMLTHRIADVTRFESRGRPSAVAGDHRAGRRR